MVSIIKNGELGTVRGYDKKIKGKLENRDRICMCVGYADDHGDDLFMMYNIGTKWIVVDYGTMLRIL